MLYAETKQMERTMNDEALNTNYSPSAKSRRITDFFQPVEAPGVVISKKVLTRCTRNKLNFLPDEEEIIPASEMPDIVIEQEPIEQEIHSLLVADDQECSLRSPPSTPHRITLCTEALDQKLDVKTESKSFQKPITGPKARRKLNTNRFTVLEEPPKAGTNRKLTVNNYLPVRKSIRKTKTTVLEEKQRILEKTLRNNIEEGLKISYFEGKGRGVVADKEFKRGDFVVEYSGDLIEISEAKKREELYAADQNAGCYMYYFEHNNHKYCIDATPESTRLGRLVNHSRNGNLMTKTVSVDGKPRLVLIAKEDIAIGQELLYDYGDRSRESLKNHPWLAY
ncbi:N-lysine methyltransferase KMT5A isoform X2 [Coccinella septempunctata]|nr:N-lysine methyltransferase KMT5A isoform X2 [Coccinella septempunctata]